MSVRMTVSNRSSLGGKSFPQSRNIDAEALYLREVELAIPKTGQLTTRTDANTGTLTMSANHGITTGARIDLYWTGGSRRGVVVGTVSVNSVPIDLGSGDDLPTNLTNIVAQVCNSEVCVLTGDNVKGLCIYAQRRGTVVIADGSDVELASVVFTEEAGGSFSWDNLSGFTNPLAGDTLAKIFFSNGTVTGTNLLRVAALYD